MLLTDGFDQPLGGRELTESDAKVICVVERVHEVAVERVNILQTGEAIEDCLDLLCKCFCCVLDFTGVELFV